MRQNVYFQIVSKATPLFYTSFQITPMHSVCLVEMFCREQVFKSLSLKWGEGEF